MSQFRSVKEEGSSWTSIHFVHSQTESGEMLDIEGHGYDEERQFYIVHLAKVKLIK